jgi:hypothetical protein
MGWVSSVASLILDRIPIEKMIFREPDHTKDREELRDIVKSINRNAAAIPVAPKSEEVASKRITIKPNSSSTSKVTTEETVDYQNRELGKILIQMERHAAQGFKIPNKKGVRVSCDCGIKHIPDIESLCEETIPMVSNPDIYYQIIDWGSEIGPKITPEANDSGIYTSQYPGMSHQARDFRKELMGTLDYKALFQEEKTQKDKLVKVTELEIPPELIKESSYPPSTIVPEVAKSSGNITNNITEKLTDEANISVKPPNEQNISEEDTRPVTANGTVCPELKTMVDWVASEDSAKCHDCIMTVTIPWYYEELEKLGDKELMADFETIQKEGDSIKIAATLDQIKEQVPPEVKQRLLEFDCATQSF